MIVTTDGGRSIWRGNDPVVSRRRKLRQSGTRDCRGLNREGARCVDTYRSEHPGFTVDVTDIAEVWVPGKERHIDVDGPNVPALDGEDTPSVVRLGTVPRWVHQADGWRRNDSPQIDDRPFTQDPRVIRLREDPQ